MTATAHHSWPASLSHFVGALDPQSGIRVAGQRRSASAGGSFTVEDPASGLVAASVSDGTSADAAAAVDAAAAAFPDWARSAPRKRSEVLHRAFELMVSRREDLAALIALENGKALPDADAEVLYAAEFFRWFSEEAVRTDGEYGEAPAGGTRTIVTRRPVGVAALVTPWNFPAAMATRKIGPALAAGCSVVLKPASLTPLTALALADILAEAGTPAGVVNVVPTADSAKVVTTWLEDSRVRKVSFTGSTGVGRTLLAQAATRIVNSSMELGGNAPFVVAADADIEAAVSGAMVAKFRNGGQACTAANRFYVHVDVAAEFTARLGAAIQSLRVGSAFEEGTTVGPLVSTGAVAAVADLVDDAIQTGARITHQAPVPNGGGYFYPPTLLEDVDVAARILREEVFGPVAPVATWKHDEELLLLANDTDYGLAAYVYSRNLRWALQLAERMEAGMVGINRGVLSDPAAPFGGVNQSGIGREGGREGIREYRETQYFSVEWSQADS